MTSRVSVDVRLSSSLERQLAAAPAMGDAMEQIAQPGLAWAEANAPRATGEYARSFEVRRVVIDGKSCAALVNTADHAVFVEWANGTHLLARAVDHIEGA